MHAGVIRSKLKKTAMEQAIKEVKEPALPTLAAHAANRSGMPLINRETCDSSSIGIYEDEAAAKAFAPKAEKVVESFKKFRSDASEPKRELFEIASSTMLETRAVVE